MLRFFQNLLLYVLPKKMRDRGEHARCEKVFTMKEPDLGKRTKGLIISLTTIPDRAHIVHYTVGALLSQSILPERIVLSISKKTFKNLSPLLTEYDSELIEFNLVEDIGPHTKLVPAMLKYPEHGIITCDDDLIYSYRWLENLWTEARAKPSDIHAYRVVEIQYNAKTKAPLPYREWKSYRKEGNGSNPRFMPMGYSGVYYPPKCLHEDFSNPDLIKDLCPKADDIWFKYMSHLAGTKSYKTKANTSKLVYVTGSQEVTLNQENINECGNDKQFAGLAAHYGDIFL